MKIHRSTLPCFAPAAVALTCALVVADARAETAAGLDSATRTALERAIADGRGARGFYGAVVERHGKIRPFAGILQAESRSEEELLALAKQYGLDAPPDPAGPAFAVPDTVADACAAAAGRERESAASFAELIGTLSASPVRETLERMREASAERHLPAFERCAALGGALPQKEIAPPRCGSCNMVGCGCSAGAGVGAAAQQPAAPPKKAGCGCQHAQQ